MVLEQAKCAQCDKEFIWFVGDTTTKWYTLEERRIYKWCEECGDAKEEKVTHDFCSRECLMDFLNGNPKKKREHVTAIFEIPFWR